MKKILIFLLGVISILITPVYARTFNPTYEIDTQIYNGDTVYIKLGIRDQNMQAVSGTLSYDSDKLTFVRATGLNSYEIDYGKELSEDKYKTFKFVADSNIGNDNIEFMELSFKITSDFDIHDTADIFFYNYEIASSDLKKYRDNGKIMTLDREEKDLMLFNLEEIDSSTKSKYWMKKHKTLIISVILVVIAVIIAFFLIPSKRKKESREENMRKQKRPENYDRENISSFVSRIEKNVTEETIVESPFKNSESRYNEEKKVDEDPLENLKEEGIEELKDEDLIQIKPIDFDSTSNDSTIDKLPIILLILLLSSFSSIGFVKADNSTDILYEIRERVIGESKYNNDYDLNDDKKIDVLDLVLQRRSEDIENKDVSNIDSEADISNLDDNNVSIVDINE